MRNKLLTILVLLVASLLIAFALFEAILPLGQESNVEVPTSESEQSSEASNLHSNSSKVDFKVTVVNEKIFKQSPVILELKLINNSDSAFRLDLLKKHELIQKGRAYHLPIQVRMGTNREKFKNIRWYPWRGTYPVKTRFDLPPNGQLEERIVVFWNYHNQEGGEAIFKQSGNTQIEVTLHSENVQLKDLVRFSISNRPKEPVAFRLFRDLSGPVSRSCALLLNFPYSLSKHERVTRSFSSKQLEKSIEVFENIVNKSKDNIAVYLALHGLICCYLETIDRYSFDKKLSPEELGQIKRLDVYKKLKIALESSFQQEFIPVLRRERLAQKAYCYFIWEKNAERSKNIWKMLLQEDKNDHIHKCAQQRLDNWELELKLFEVPEVNAKEKDLDR
jgi:hypothetical protein